MFLDGKKNQSTEQKREIIYRRNHLTDIRYGTEQIQSISK